MKLPSIFKTSSHQKFEIKPRYYDPIKEELEERTSRIKKELEGGVSPTDELNTKGVGTSIRGSFSSHRGIKQRDTSMFSTTSMIRTVLFFGMLAAAFGYIYIGPEIFNYLTYLALAVGGFYLFFRLKKKGENE
jgi:hypothetical protein